MDQALPEETRDMAVDRIGKIPPGGTLRHTIPTEEDLPRLFGDPWMPMTTVASQRPA